MQIAPCVHVVERLGVDELDARQVDVREAGDAQRMTVLLERFVGFRHVLGRVGNFDLGRDKAFRCVGQQTAWLASGVVHDGASVGRVGRDSGDFQRLAVHPIGMVRYVADHDGLVGADGVEVLFLRARVRSVGLQIGVLHERSAVVHFVVGMRFHELADDAQILLVVHGAFGDGDLEQFFVIRLWAVQVAVHEARAQELAAEVDDLGRVAYERLDAGIVSYVHDVAAAHGDGLRYVSFVYERLHVAVLEYEVGRLAGCLRFGFDARVRRPFFCGRAASERSSQQHPCCKHRCSRYERTARERALPSQSLVRAMRHDDPFLPLFDDTLAGSLVPTAPCPTLWPKGACDNQREDGCLLERGFIFLYLVANMLVEGEGACFAEGRAPEREFARAIIRRRGKGCDGLLAVLLRYGYDHGERGALYRVRCVVRAEQKPSPSLARYLVRIVHG